MDPTLPPIAPSSVDPETRLPAPSTPLRPQLRLREAILVLGVIHLVSGMAVILLGFILVSRGLWTNNCGAPFWGGAIFVTSGLLGFANGRSIVTGRAFSFRRNPGWLVLSFLVTSCASLVLAFVVLVLSLVSMTTKEVAPTAGGVNDVADEGSEMLLSLGLIVVISLVEVIGASWSVVVCCRLTRESWMRYVAPLQQQQQQQYLSVDYPTADTSSSNPTQGFSCSSTNTQIATANQCAADRNISHPYIEQAPPILLQSPNSETSARLPDGTYMMLSAEPGGQRRSQVVYVMSTSSTTVLQPGSGRGDAPSPPSSPPPSYSTLSLHRLGTDHGGSIDVLPSCDMPQSMSCPGNTASEHWRLAESTGQDGRRRPSTHYRCAPHRQLAFRGNLVNNPQDEPNMVRNRDEVPTRPRRLLDYVEL